MKKGNKLLIMLLAAALILSSSGCKKGDSEKETQAQNSLSEYSESTDTIPAGVTAEASEAPVVEPSKETEIPVSESAYYSYSVQETGAEPLYQNPLTGLESEKDLSTQRPCAVMIGNIRASMPQVGISEADIIYECLAEGGITRLLMVVSDYESLGKIGSIRSSRPYYIDFAANHDAIYVHAGGSVDAYSALESRNIDNMDGVNGAYSGTIFYRDPERRATMAYEHTMVSDGGRLAQGIELFGYRETHDEDFVDPINHPEWGYTVELLGDSTEYVKIPYNSSRYDTQIVEYEYDAETGKYLRYQHDHDPHIDGTTGEQLAFDNIIILNLKHYATGDSYGHRDVTTTGSGSGYYITGGKRIAINWTKETKDGNISFTTADGKALVINRGKTVVNIVEDSTYSSLTMN